MSNNDDNYLACCELSFHGRSVHSVFVFCTPLLPWYQLAGWAKGPKGRVTRISVSLLLRSYSPWAFPLALAWFMFHSATFSSLYHSISQCHRASIFLPSLQCTQRSTMNLCDSTQTVSSPAVRRSASGSIALLEIDEAASY